MARLFFPKMEVRDRGFDTLVRFANKIEFESRKIRVSAMKSLGYSLFKGLRAYIVNQKFNWPEPSIVSTKFHSKYKVGERAKWTRRRGFKGSLRWLGKFVRYRVNREGTFLDIDFGKTKRGQPGRPDRQLVGIVRKHQEGYSFNVTPKMRRFFAAQKAASTKKKPKKGVDFFPLPKSRTRIKVPARQIIDPYYDRIKGNVNKLLQRKIERQYSRLSRKLNVA